MQGELASIHHSFRNLGSGAQAHRRAVSKQPDGCIGLPNSSAISLPYQADINWDNHIWNDT